MNNIAAGELRHRIVIQTVSESAATSKGEKTLSWADTATRWGSIEPLAGRERYQAQQVQPEATHRIRHRYYSGLTTRHRYKFGTRIFTIEALLNPGEEKVYQEALVKENA